MKIDPSKALKNLERNKQKLATLDQRYMKLSRQLAGIGEQLTNLHLEVSLGKTLMSYKGLTIEDSERYSFKSHSNTLFCVKSVEDGVATYGVGGHYWKNANKPGRWCAGISNTKYGPATGYCMLDSEFKSKAAARKAILNWIVGSQDHLSGA